MYLSDVMSPKFEASTSKFFLKVSRKAIKANNLFNFEARRRNESNEGQRHNFLMSSANDSLVKAGIGRIIRDL